MCIASQASVESNVQRQRSTTMVLEHERERRQSSDPFGSINGTRTSDAALAPLDRMESHPQIRTVVPDEMYMFSSGSVLAVL